MKIRIEKSKYGLGVFATDNIQKYDVIEIAYALYVENMACPKNSLLNPYVFDSGAYGLSLIGLGNASFYNHADNPNAEFVVNIGNTLKDRPTIHITAIKDINKDEEIFINYEYEPINFVTF